MQSPITLIFKGDLDHANAIFVGDREYRLWGSISREHGYLPAEEWIRPTDSRYRPIAAILGPEASYEDAVQVQDLGKGTIFVGGRVFRGLGSSQSEQDYQRLGITVQRFPEQGYNTRMLTDAQRASAMHRFGLLVRVARNIIRM